MAEESFKVTIGPQGRLVIPARLREALGLRPGDVMLARVEDDRLVMERRHAILARVQERFAAAVPPDVSLVDELIAERRQEAKHENGG